MENSINGLSSSSTLGNIHFWSHYYQLFEKNTGEFKGTSIVSSPSQNLIFSGVLSELDELWTFFLF